MKYQSGPPGSTTFCVILSIIWGLMGYFLNPLFYIPTIFFTVGIFVSFLPYDPDDDSWLWRI